MTDKKSLIEKLEEKVDVAVIFTKPNTLFGKEYQGLDSWGELDYSLMGVSF